MCVIMFVGEVICEPPNNRLHKFRGRMDWNGESYSMDNDQIVLRVSLLANKVDYTHTVLVSP